MLKLCIVLLKYAMLHYANESCDLSQTWSIMNMYFYSQLFEYHNVNYLLISDWYSLKKTYYTLLFLTMFDCTRKHLDTIWCLIGDWESVPIGRISPDWQTDWQTGSCYWRGYWWPPESRSSGTGELSWPPCSWCWSSTHKAG